MLMQYSVWDAYLNPSLLLIVGMFLILSLAMGIFVYLSAQKRGMNAELWLLIIVLSSIIGVIIFLIVRSPKKKRRKNR